MELPNGNHLYPAQISEREGEFALIPFVDSSLPVMATLGSNCFRDDRVKEGAMVANRALQGSPSSDSTAFRCVGILKPKLNNVEEESWEELENADIGSGAPSLRWLVWPNIDEVSKAIMAAECPQIIVNPPFGFPEVPNEALDFVALDYSIIDAIDPKTWDVSGTARGSAPKLTVSNETSELSIADFLEGRATLVPKQAIYARQNKRRAKREHLMSSSSPKSIMRASQASKFLHHRRRTQVEKVSTNDDTMAL
ncbi:hypothetical protein ZIOFF_013588 [Zingiber officinale]|uniref:Uncharacterized protein n=1 Tax=Zingiber officinale TaxID=94328 RepID=A0A8J5LUA8_ZINOF|nr:hypothetical protein ZIOFF_013588 [Zingiber officinale]